MDSTGNLTTTSTSSAPAGRLPARPAGTSLAGLIDVLDRVDGQAAGPARRRPSAHRPTAPGAGHRVSGFRATSTRGMPLRSVQPAPPARPRTTPAVEPGSYWDMTRPAAASARVERNPRQPLGAPTGLAALIRRAALWGAGAEGENLAWRTALSTIPRPQASTGVTPRTPRLRGLVRRLALWGAGDDGANLAWGVSRTAATARRLDRPVLLREMPSTPLIQPAASSPVAALVPAVPVPAGRRPIGPVLPRVAPVESAVGWAAPAHPASAAPSGWPAPPAGWPRTPAWPPATPPVSRSRPPSFPVSPRSVGSTSAVPPPRIPIASPRERGLARARSDPLPSLARGSPPALRRSRPSAPWASIWSPAPASLPPPREATAAPG